ncbi:DUF551 domain-containing protein [Raoultella ornithinolytica]|uniref:DUF551 domain-containing protein n=1 Tax=Raoultella ornithinolytica TaxID=54291 RepID=UPI001EF8B434|nr:DUF551 domain-containing protein [Raoultella ornithinolytica]ULI45996.1 DUF551 domain-containing protein [Raoultella ornithinolytica]
MTSKISIDNRELLQKISTGEAAAGIDFGNAIVRELAAFRLAAMDSKPVAEVVSVFGDSESIGERELKLLVGIQNMPYGTKFYRHAQPAPELKPVGYIFVSGQGAIAYSPTDWGMPGFKLAGQIFGDIDVESQPAPVVPDIDELRLAFEAAERESDDGFNLHKYGIGYADDETQGRWDTWLACRAAMLQAGNSPVIPEGYVMVPKEPTKEMIDAGWLHFMGTKNPSSKGTYKAMLAAAPQPQNEPQNIPEIIPQWIPVSERIPETDGNYWGWWSESKRQGPVWFIKSELQAQFQSHEITHWMPLPAAPQEVKGEHQIRDEIDMGARITSHRFKV